MGSLEHFIVASDQLVQFNCAFQEVPIVDKTISYLEISKDELKSIWLEVKMTYSNCLKNEDLDDKEMIRAKYRSTSTIYISCLSEIIDTSNKMKLILKDNEENNALETHTHYNTNIKVPPCDTEIFCGDYLTWPSFRDMFTAVYINHPKLCAVQKLFHLRSKTKGEAHKIVSKFPLTGNNFTLAWDALKSQYENLRILVNNQIKNLLNLPVLSIESGKDIRDLLRNINDCLSILKTQNVSIESWDPILVYLCSSRLPESTLSLWEQSIKTPNEIPKWIDMDIFLTNRYRVLETVSDLKLSIKSKGQQSKAQTSHPNFNQRHKAFHNKVYNFDCILCQDPHPLRLCPKFLELNVSDRISKVNVYKFCQNCLSPTHELKTCRSKYHCSVCKKRHHSLLHIPSTQSISASQKQSSQPFQSIQSTSPNNSHQVNTCFAHCNKRVLLATALINIFHLGDKYSLRALIDSGSEVTLLSEEIQRKLNLPVKSIQARISGMSDVVTAHSSKLCRLLIGSRYDPSFLLDANAIVLKKLTGDLPSCFILPEEISNNFDLNLADPFFYKNSKIDIVIGSDLYPSIIKEGIKHKMFGSLVGQNTAFGWILSGPLSAENFKCNTTILSDFSENSIDKQIEKFWEVEEVQTKSFSSLEDEICEKLYSETTTRDNKGRYIVKLPFKEPSLGLGHSRNIALKQFLRTENSLKRNPELHIKYNQVLEEYNTLGHMKVVPSEELIEDNKICSYYLPHHAVIKAESLTTKTRVVFNASNSSSNGISLNDILHIGPSLQKDLMILILKWRFYRFVFNADIEKMYRQILVHPDHSTYQRILYRRLENNDNNIEDFELKTVTFGVNCAPFLAIRTLLQLAEDVQNTYPLASTILKEEFFVDDVLSGAHDIETALDAQCQLSLALNSAGFSLRKWTSNSIHILNAIPISDRYDQDFLQLEDKSISKTLGIKWNAKSDTFHFSFKALKDDHLVTKRAVLSVISRLFDPAGWLSPIIITAKIIMQQIWRDKTSWDSKLEPQTRQRWEIFFATLPDIQNIQVPRWIEFKPSDSIQVHGFSDASEQAYAAALYIRIRHSEHNYSCHLLCSKTKVAPVKQLALPRLELCGAVLLSSLYKKIISELNVSQHEVFLWADSSIVLAWLKKPPYMWKTFVGNRVSQIQSNAPIAKWNHVRSIDNPADLPTRGLSPNEIVTNNLWWHGPPWLCEDSLDWPKSLLRENDETCLELKPIKSNIATLKPNIDVIIERFSTWSKSLRVMCFILRFLHRTRTSFKNNFSHTSRVLSQDEIRNAKIFIIRLTQSHYFFDEYQALLQNKPIPRKSSLVCLNPTLDSDSIMRSNSRLTSSTLSYSEKYPILLAYQAQISSQLVKFVHTISLHGENQLVVRLLRYEFWIPKIKTLVKKHINQCKTCIINKRQTQTQIMAALPLERTQISAPFAVTGLDFAGPFSIKSFSGRNCRVTKGYVCLFVCFATKAIHLEATSDLTSKSFIAALNRFIARRGMPKTIFSDNGTNLVGADKILKNEFKNFLNSLTPEIAKQFEGRNLEWKFIPPGAPHIGGLWEAGIKSFKVHFRKVTGTNKLSFEEFVTLLAKIESCLNSRPISPISNNASEILPLTPGHFLRGGPLLVPLEPSLDEKSLRYVKRWEKVQILHQQFCARWKNEYLRELTKRYKWKFPKRDLALDDLVIIKDENLPPNDWRLGRVVKVYRGTDNRVRVADIRTQHGTITRPIVKLCILP